MKDNFYGRAYFGDIGERDFSYAWHYTDFTRASFNSMGSQWVDLEGYGEGGFASPLEEAVGKKIHRKDDKYIIVKLGDCETHLPRCPLCTVDDCQAEIYIRRQNQSTTISWVCERDEVAWGGGLIEPKGVPIDDFKEGINSREVK